MAILFIYNSAKFKLIARARTLPDILMFVFQWFMLFKKQKAAEQARFLLCGPLFIIGTTRFERATSTTPM